MYYEENRIGLLDEHGWKEHSLDEMDGEGLSEKVVMAAVFICLSNLCPPYIYVFGADKWLPKQWRVSLLNLGFQKWVSFLHVLFPVVLAESK